MPEDKRHATGSGGGRLASEDRTGTIVPDFENVRYEAEETSRPFRREDPEKGWFASLSPFQMRRSVAAGVVALMVVGVIVWLSLDHRDAGVVVEPVVKRVESEGLPPTVVTTTTADELQQLAEATVREFMEADTIERRARVVLNTEGVEERMADYYGRSGSSVPDGFGEMQKLSPAAFDGAPLYWVEAMGKGGGRSYFFNVVPLRERMVIEWDSSVAYGELSWEEFLRSRPTEAVQMRVEVEGSNYYNHEFSDDRIYKAYKLRGHGLEEAISGYVVRDSEAGRILAWVGKTPGSFRYNLRLRWLEESRAPRSVEIVEVLHRHWADTEALHGLMEEE